MPNTPPIPENEELRLAALNKYRILDTDIEEDFDRITRFAADYFDVPIALVSLVDDKRQWFKSRIGLDVTETSREIAFCAHAICTPESLVVNDALKDDRFKESPLVLGDPNIRFYAGAPLTTSNGQNLGTLCVIDRVPRTLTETQRRFLRDLAKIVMNQLELRLSMLRAEEDLLRGIENVQVLRDSQTRLNAIFNSTLDAILVLDAQGCIESHNTAAEKLFGYSSTELNQLPAKTLMPESFDKEAEKYFRNYEKLGTDQIFLGYGENIRGHKKSGETFPMELSLSAMQLNNERYFTVVIRDMSEHRRAEIALLHSISTTEKTNNAMSELLNRVGHELRTPLNAIVGFTEILESEMQSKLTLNQQEYLNKVVKGGKQLASLINEILALKATRTEDKVTKVNLADVIKDSWKLVETEAMQSNISFRSNAVEFSSFNVEANLEGLRQVLFNLYSNAVKFNTIGGSVEVLITKESENSYQISVKDDGAGINKEDQSHIFDVLKRLEQHEYRVGGLGIGLAICKAIVEKMNGRIWVESVPGTGSTFFIELPEQHQTDNHQPSRINEDPGKPSDNAKVEAATVLLITSAAAELNLLESIAGGLPELTLLSALRGQLGYALALRNRPALIILDSDLPDQDSTTILEKLRSNAKTVDIPIIILATADSILGQTIRIDGTGSDFWVKPLNRSAVIQDIADRFNLNNPELLVS